MATQRILTLDPALHLGWAFDSAQPGVPCGATEVLPATEGTKGEGIERGRPLLHLRRFLIRQIGTLHPTMVVKEAPINIVMMNYKGRRLGTNRNAIELQFAMAGIIEEVCYELQVPLRDAEAGDIKVYAGGAKNSDKEPCMAFCRRLGWTYEDDNCADAKVLWSLSKVTYDKGWSPAAAKAPTEPLIDH